jgi:hypothetical protein
LQEAHEFAKEQIFQTQSVLEGLRSNLADENRKLDGYFVKDCVKKRFCKRYPIIIIFKSMAI